MKKLNLILLGGLFILAIICHIYAVDKASEYEKLNRYYKQKYEHQIEISKNWDEKCKMLQQEIEEMN